MGLLHVSAQSDVPCASFACVDSHLLELCDYRQVHFVGLGKLVLVAVVFPAGLLDVVFSVADLGGEVELSLRDGVVFVVDALAGVRTGFELRISKRLLQIAQKVAYRYSTSSYSYSTVP